MVKLVGAHVGVLAAIVVFTLIAPLEGWTLSTLVAAVSVATGIFLLLAMVALRPLRDIENVVSRVRRGDFGARVTDSLVADRDMARVGAMFNLLLDRLSADRLRMHKLASLVIEASDKERAELARELHDSTAQQLAALKLQLSAAERDCLDTEISQRLQTMRVLAGEALEEVRLLANVVHPRVLDDLGLPVALRKLARDAAPSGAVEIDVATDAGTDSLPHPVASVLYRVAQSAVHNVLRHAEARRVELHLSSNADAASLEVADDGRGFDVELAERKRPGMGLFTMRERVALAGGQLRIHSKPGVGTRVVASVPLTPQPIETSVEEFP
jgi:signal transduction histidine kinase